MTESAWKNPLKQYTVVPMWGCQEVLPSICPQNWIPFGSSLELHTVCSSFLQVVQQKHVSLMSSFRSFLHQLLCETIIVSKPLLFIGRASLAPHRWKMMAASAWTTKTTNALNPRFFRQSVTLVDPHYILALFCPTSFELVSLYSCVPTCVNMYISLFVHSFQHATSQHLRHDLDLCPPQPMQHLRSAADPPWLSRQCSHMLWHEPELVRFRLCMAIHDIIISMISEIFRPLLR